MTAPEGQQGVAPKKGMAPRTLIDERRGRVQELSEIRPHEAFSVAKRLLDEYPEDDDAVSLCLKAAVKAGTVSEDLCNMAEKVADNRFFNPEIISLSLASKAAINKGLGCDDMVKLRRAYILDPRITRETMSLVKDKLSGDESAAVRAIFGREVEP